MSRFVGLEGIVNDEMATVVGVFDLQYDWLG